MIDFLKRFGLGILYILVSPFAIAFLVLWTLYTIVVFIIELIHGIRSFFKGRKFFDEFPEDIEAKKILNLEQFAPSSTPVEEQKEETPQV